MALAKRIAALGTRMVGRQFCPTVRSTVLASVACGHRHADIAEKRLRMRQIGRTNRSDERKCVHFDRLISSSACVAL